MAAATAAATLPNPPSLVEQASPHGTLRFLIFDAPNDANLPLYVAELKKYHVTHVVRVCDPTYQAEKLEEAGIKVHHWSFTDGAAPPAEVLTNWRNLITQVFSVPDTKDTIGIHCVAGLGRAPVLVTVALIDAGLENAAAIEQVRGKRKGALNSAQLRFLKDYKPAAHKCVIS